jgi:hypothetical protein
VSLESVVAARLSIRSIVTSVSAVSVVLVAIPVVSVVVLVLIVVAAIRKEGGPLVGVLLLPCNDRGL